MKKLYCKHINVTVDVKGPTGSGKSQIIDLLVDALKDEDVLITTFDNPNKEHSIKIISKPQLPLPVIECRLFQMQGGIGLKQKDGSALEPGTYIVRIVD